LRLMIRLLPSFPAILCRSGTLLALVLNLFPFGARADLWCTGYYPGWEQGGMPASAIDYPALTHIIHFSIVPNADSTLNTSDNSLTAVNSANIIASAHAAGKKVLVCVGGASTQTQFQGATSDANRSAFITNLVNLMSSRGYDGIDVDWEPLDPGDARQFTNFINGLRVALNVVTPRPLLAAAIAAPPTPASVIAAVQGQFDQINLMTYDLSGPYPGWVTWFNAPIFDGGYRFPSTGGLVPSANGMVNGLLAAGVPAGRLGIGIAFYGWIWSGGVGTSTGGAALPRQSWTTAPTTAQLSYNAIMSTYYQASLYRWDTSAQAAYLTIDNTGSSSDKFISYDDERTCQSKVSYARNNHLGGVMIWELAQDHHANQVDPLLYAIKQALATPGAAHIQRNGSNLDLSFTGAPLGSYNVQWTTNLPQGPWSTLTVTNIQGTGGVVHIPDAPTEPARFYRVRTPP
jgi:chitinase